MYNCCMQRTSFPCSHLTTPAPYSLSAPSSTVIPEPWEEGTCVDASFSAEHLTDTYSLNLDQLWVSCLSVCLPDLCVCVRVGVRACARTMVCSDKHWKFRGQLVGVYSFLPPCGSQGSYLGLQTWQQVPRFP